MRTLCVTKSAGPLPLPSKPELRMQHPPGLLRVLGVVVLDFSTEIERRFFDADSIDVDASIDRGAPNRSKINTALQDICQQKSTRRGFRGANNFLLARR